MTCDVVTNATLMHLLIPLGALHAEGSCIAVYFCVKSYVSKVLQGVRPGSIQSTTPQTQC